MSRNYRVIPIATGQPDAGASTRWYQRAAQSLRDRPVVCACLLAAMTIAAYVPAVGGPFIFDDRLYVTGDERMHAPGGLGRIWTEVAGAEYRHQYCPLTTSLFWLQYQLWGLNPAGYHAVNLILHVANSLLLWTLLRRMRVPWSWLAAAIFALHPVHVPSVAWIAELKNVLSGFMFLSSLLAFGVAFELFDRGDSGPLPGRARALGYAAGLCLLALALLSKAASALVPVALLAAMWWRRGTPKGRDLRMLVPPFVMALAGALGAAWLEGSHAADGWAPPVSWPQRLVIAGRAAWFYAGKLIFPYPLSLVYPRWEVQAGSWWQWLAPLGVLAGLGAAWHARARMGRAPLAAAGYFVAAVVPVSLAHVAFNRYSFVADHWVYWASFGLVALAAGGAGAAAARAAPWARTALWGGAPIVLALLGGLTWQRAGLFDDPVALWTNAMRVSPASREVRYNLAVALQDDGRMEEAEAQYRAALALDPGDVLSRNNLGILLRARGEAALAIEQYELALRAAPRFLKAHVNLGEALQAEGRMDEAVARYEAALRIDPSSPEAHFNLAVALRAMNLPNRAILHYQAALARQPEWPEAHLNLGEALQSQGRLHEAIAHYREALRLDGTSAAAAHNLALALSDRR